jgi:hypothetical protein
MTPQMYFYFNEQQEKLTYKAMIEDPLLLTYIRSLQKLEELLCLCNLLETGVICLTMSNRCKQLQKTEKMNANESVTHVLESLQFHLSLSVDLEMQFKWVKR